MTTPLENTPNDAEISPEQGEAKKVNTGDRTVLIVDDNPTNLGVLSNYLREYGFRILVARNGESALKRLQYARADIILLDVMMPGLNGFETCDLLKANEETKNIPVIFMTALSEAEDKIKGFKAGAVDYVTKPLQHEEVLLRITTHLRIQELTRSLQEQNVRLQGTLDELKQTHDTLSKRALQMEASSQISQRITSILNLDELLVKVAELIRSKFGYYFVGIWLANEVRQAVVLRVGAVAGKVHFLEDGYAIPMQTDDSLILSVCRTGEVASAENVNLSAQHLGLGELAEDHLELVLPLRIGQNVTGVLDIWHDQTIGLAAEDKVVLQTMADQIAIAIHNAELYSMSQQELAERKRAEAALQKANEELSQTLENLKATQQQLIESEKMASLGGLVAGVAHEINTPIGIGVTAASTLESKTKQVAAIYDEGKLKGSALKEYMDKAIRSSQLILSNLERASELVQSFKKVAVDQTNLERRVFVVKGYIEDVLLSLRPKLKKTKHIVEVQGDDALSLDSHPGAFSQIVTNLIMNSLVHAYKEEDAGHLRFNLVQQGERCILEYSDDGCGIPPENLSKIFEPFFTTARGRGGSGLGMHIVYNLVTQKLKGTIRCESQIGAGTKFIINLPIRLNEEK